MPVWQKNKSRCQRCNVIMFPGIGSSGRHHCRKCGRVVCASCSKYRMDPNGILLQPTSVPKGTFSNSRKVRVCRLCFETRNDIDHYIRHFYTNLYKEKDFFIFGHIHDVSNFQGALFVNQFLLFLEKHAPNELSNITVCSESACWGLWKSGGYGSRDRMFLAEEECSSNLSIIEKFALGNKKFSKKEKMILNETMDVTTNYSAKDVESIRQIAPPQLINLLDFCYKRNIQLIKYDDQGTTPVLLGKNEVQYVLNTSGLTHEETIKYKSSKYNNYINYHNNPLYPLIMSKIRLTIGNERMANNLACIYNRRKSYYDRPKQKYLVLVGKGHIGTESKFKMDTKWHHRQIIGMQSHLRNRFKFKVHSTIFSTPREHELNIIKYPNLFKNTIVNLRQNGGDFWLKISADKIYKFNNVDVMINYTVSR